MNSTYLIHHGIKNQKWGDRNGPPYPLSASDHSAAEKAAGTKGWSKEAKRVSKSLYKEVKKSRSFSQPYRRSEEFKTKAKNAIIESKVITENDKKNLISKREKIQKALQNNTKSDYFSSDQAQKDSAKAYNDTLEWFKKNDPTYLKEIVKSNDNSYDNLDHFHDFRKTFEGFEDEALTKGEEIWNRNHDNKASEKEYADARREYFEECKKISEKLLGEYGNIVTTKADKYNPALTLNDDVADVVDIIVNEYLTKK